VQIYNNSSVGKIIFQNLTTEPQLGIL